MTEFRVHLKDEKTYFKEAEEAVCRETVATAPTSVACFD